MRHLVEQQVYMLPNGTFLIPLQADGEWVLYTYPEWIADRPAAHSLTADGHVAYRGEPTPWQASDLTAVALMAGRRGRRAHASAP